jgi:hypothetical protein
MLPALYLRFATRTASVCSRTAINTMGWLGFLAVVPWMQAFMWAFKPTDVVDIRKKRGDQGDHHPESQKVPDVQVKTKHRDTCRF